MFDIECFLDWRPFSFDEGDGDAARSDHGKMLMMIALFLGGLGAAQWAPSSFLWHAFRNHTIERVVLHLRSLFAMLTLLIVPQVRFAFVLYLNCYCAFMWVTEHYSYLGNSTRFESIV